MSELLNRAACVRAEAEWLRCESAALRARQATLVADRTRLAGDYREAVMEVRDRFEAWGWRASPPDQDDRATRRSRPRGLAVQTRPIPVPSPI